MIGLDYKTFNWQEYNVTDYDSAIKLLDMFMWEFFKKECAMTPRDDKWGNGLLKVQKFLKELKKKNDQL